MMTERYLYQQIAESIRRDILEGRLKPGQRLPSMRRLRQQWNCTPGTVQRAYRELARQGLLVSHAGRGTQVAGDLPLVQTRAAGSLRRASLVHRSEAFLLEAITAGYDLTDIRQAFDLAMDRWRAIERQPEKPAAAVRFCGSHDMVINALAQRFEAIYPSGTLHIRYSGSLGGLMALAEGRAELAGCHLWDAENDSYNLPFVQRLLPGKKTRVVTLAHRWLGLILPPGNPHGLNELANLFGSGIRFVNRQSGSGTRVWLDVELKRRRLDGSQMRGYDDERLTHSDVARAVAEGEADVGVGLQAAAAAYGLDFSPLARERYDLVLLESVAGLPPLTALLDWLASPEAKSFVAEFPGYDAEQTGFVQSS